jgi:putative addiction module component (TIGR02574 family)
MVMTKDQVKSAAMQLDPIERESLAEELLLSIDQQESAEIDAAWLAEVKRRDAEFIAGRASAKPVDDVINRLLAKSSN